MYKTDKAGGTKLYSHHSHWFVLYTC